MATTSEIIRWVAGKVLDRAPADDDIPSETDLAGAFDPYSEAGRDAIGCLCALWPVLFPAAPFPHGASWIPAGAIGFAGSGDGRLYAIRQMIDDDGGQKGEVLDVEAVHAVWLKIPEEGRPPSRHPLAPLVREWLNRPRAPVRSTVTVTGGESVAMTRRLAVVSHVRMTRWAVEAVDTVAVDGGGPMVARLPDPAAVFDSRGERTERTRPWTRYRPGEQGRLEFHGLGSPLLPVNIRLAALAGLDTVLAGDMLMLWTVADALDHPMGLDEQTGARLLARTRSGDFRRPQPSDIRRFWDATATLRGLLMFDPAGTGRWAEVAHVESFPCSVTIGPPSWRRFGKGKGRYILTAEGGRAGRHRIAVGKQGAHGRLITGIEYALGARYLGKPGVAPDLRPARGKGGPGAVLTLPLPVAAALMGEDDPTENEAARKRLNRSIETARPQYESGPGRHDTAKAGDSVEIIGRIRGSRAHPAALRVRASARFVEAARRAQLAGGKGFETVTIADWLGLDLDVQ